MNDAPLERVQSFKYLGIVIHKNLSWKCHIENLQAKDLQRLGILRRIKHLLPRHARTLFVNTMITSIMEYGSLVWGDKGSTILMDNIQELHNKAAKFVLDRPIQNKFRAYIHGCTLNAQKYAYTWLHFLRSASNF